MADMFDKEELGIVSSLFGVSPAMQNKAMQQAAYKRGTEAGQNLLGGVLGNVGMFSEAAGQGLRAGLGVQTPEERMMGIRQQAQQQFDTNTPEGLLQMADFLNQQGDAAGARQAVMLAQGQQARTQGIATSRATEQARLREKVNSAEEQANRTRLEDLINQFGPVEGANKFRQEQLSGRQSVAAAGVVKQGGNISSAIKDYQGTVKPYTDTIDASETVVSLINEAQKTNNPTAYEGARVQLARAVGNSSLSRKDIEAAGGDPSIAGKIVDTTSVLFTGVPSTDTLRDIARAANIVKKAAQIKKDKITMQQRDIAEKEFNFTPEQLDRQFPLSPKPAKLPAAEQQAPIYATNPSTKERIMSTDGGKTWNPVGGQ